MYMYWKTQRKKPTPYPKGLLMCKVNQWSWHQFKANRNPRCGVQRRRKLYLVQTAQLRSAWLWDSMATYEMALSSGPSLSRQFAPLCSGLVCSALLCSTMFPVQYRSAAFSRQWKEKVCFPSQGKANL